MNEILEVVGISRHCEIILASHKLACNTSDDQEKLTLIHSIEIGDKQSRKARTIFLNIYVVPGRYGKSHKFSVSQIYNSNIYLIQFHLDND